MEPLNVSTRHANSAALPRTIPFGAEEALIADARAGLTPAQMVEHKLASLLKSAPLPVSHLMTPTRLRRRM
jgi:hypothetical protein